MPITNFPEAGGDKPVSLRSSQYELFPVSEAEQLRQDFPAIWDKGGNILGNKQFDRLAPMAKDRRSPQTATEEEAVRLREAWAARHLEDFRIAGVVAQVKWLVVGSRGLDYMRQVLMQEKSKLAEKRTVQAQLVMKDETASFIMTSAALDRQGEVVELDGWDFKNFMMNPVILDTHRYESINDIVGRAKSEPRREADGWVVDIEFADTERGKVAKQLVKQGMLNAVSVGFRSTQRRKEGRTVHHVQKELLEVSLVAVPANPAAVRVKAATDFADLDLADADRAWDGPAAEQRVQSYAGARGNDFSEMDWQEYAKAFLWVDPDREDQIGGYKLGFADVIDGQLVAVPRGLFACAAVLAGARGGVDIPEEDRAGVVDLLRQYYAKMDREVPPGAETEADMAEAGYMAEEDKPKRKNEQMMELRDHLVSAAAIVDALLQGYEMEDEPEEGQEDDAEMEAEAVKAHGGTRQTGIQSQTLVEALKAAVAAIGGK